MIAARAMTTKNTFHLSIDPIEPRGSLIVTLEELVITTLERCTLGGRDKCPSSRNMTTGCWVLGDVGSSSISNTTSSIESSDTYSPSYSYEFKEALVKSEAGEGYTSGTITPDLVGVLWPGVGVVLHPSDSPNSSIETSDCSIIIHKY